MLSQFHGFFNAIPKANVNFRTCFFEDNEIDKPFLRIFMIWIFWPGAFVKILNSDKIVLFTLTHDKIHFASQLLLLKCCRVRSTQVKYWIRYRLFSKQKKLFNVWFLSWVPVSASKRLRIAFRITFFHFAFTETQMRWIISFGARIQLIVLFRSINLQTDLK